MVSEISINLRRSITVKYLAIGIAFLAIMHLAGMVLRYGFGLQYAFGLVPKFDMGIEANIPTFFSAVLFFIASVLLFVIGLNAKAKKLGRQLHWYLLAVIFAYLSIDEASGLHEILIEPFQRWFGLGYEFHQSWLIAAVPIIIIIGLFLFRFILSLDNKIRNIFVIAAVIFISGAVVLEFIEGFYYDYSQKIDIIYASLTLIEEALEMAGILVFINGLLQYIKMYSGKIFVTISD